MKITVFDAGNGDSLLLRSEGGKSILIDGGRPRPFRENIAPALGKLRDQNQPLDLVCVSHYDQDHIGGILKMLNTEFDWRVFEFRKDQGLSVDEPDVVRPPEIKEIWHNAFFESLGKNRGDIAEQFAAIAAAALASGVSAESHGNNFYVQISTSINEAAQVSRRIGKNQLNIPLNKTFGGKLAARRGAPIIHKIGDFKITVIGPTHERLAKLRREWRKWLKSSAERFAKQRKKLKKQGKEDEEALIQGDLDDFFGLSEISLSLASRNKVTAPNVASIVLLIAENGKRILCTGDARDDTILDDLRDCELLDSQGQIHLDALKIQHHGSKNNLFKDFAKQVTADNYLFCSNGAGSSHHHPDLEVVKLIVNSRIGEASVRTRNPAANGSFKIWFTSDGNTKGADSAHYKKLKDYMATVTDPRCKRKFSSGKCFSISL